MELLEMDPSSQISDDTVWLRSVEGCTAIDDRVIKLAVIGYHKRARHINGADIDLRVWSVCNLILCTKHEILGRNCRFLQAPDGKIKGGEIRKYVDANAVHYLKTRIEAQAEAQTSLINYRKGGQSFTNLLTMIPIPYGENPDEITYFVGFQVDLVDQPSAMMNKGRGKTPQSVSQGRFSWHFHRPGWFFLGKLPVSATAAVYPTAQH